MDAVLARPEVPAKGRTETLLTVSRFGRYAIIARSSQGAALQLIDRMAGPGEISGVPGVRYGRLDLFLDRGEYKIVVLSAEKGSGNVALAVRRFPERNPEPGSVLVEQKPVEGSLIDFEQRSWWIEVKDRRPLAIEAAGRNLADLRLWQDGSWLVDAAPASEVITPSPGEPLLDCRLSTDVEPGLYRLVAYGGPSQEWARDSAEHPFHLRFGIPTLPEAGRRRFSASPFGIDRYLVPGSVNFFRLELPQARDASIQVASWSAEKPFDNDGPSRSIRKNFVPPVAELDGESQPGTFHSVVIHAAAGQPYVLQQFEARNLYRFGAEGRYWISTIHSGDPGDSIDATALVMRYPRAGTPPSRLEPLLSAAVPLGPGTPWARKFNLLERATVFLDVRDAGTYEAIARGTSARIRIEPFFLSPPEHYESPPFQQSGGKWELERGFAVLTIEPVKKGIVDVVLRSTGADPAIAAPDRAAARPSAIFPDVPLAPEDFYAVYVNDQPGVRSGLVVRPLPLDLAQELPIAESAGQSLDVLFQAGEPGILRAEGEDGTPFPISVDGGPSEDAIAVAPGKHTLTLHNLETRTRIASVRLFPSRLAADAALPVLPASEAILPQFPLLARSEAPHVDLDPKQRSTFLVRADAPSLYRVETTGLLATAGTLRTRTNPSFRAESANGTGRNFLIQEYLREGDYQLTVAPVGTSRGHAGVVLSRTDLIDGGTLADRVPARATLPAGRAIAYRFSVPNRAEYRLRAVGLGHTFRCRLETADGWPVDRPAAAADITRVLDAGAYRLIVLPEALDSRVLTVLARRRIPRRRSGHGPHFLPLAQTVSYEWRESNPRAADRWEFSLPAEAGVSIALTDEMTGALRRGGDPADGPPLASVTPAGPWKGRLAAGKYRLDAACARINDRVRYRVSVRPTELLAGLERDAAAPSVLSLSVGREGLVRLSSFGAEDVRARLLDASGRVLAEDDDRTDDWNFEIARRLSPGPYRLEIQPVGTASASSTISMEMPREVAENALALPIRKRLRPGRAVHLIPFEIPSGDALLLASARSAESIGIAIETRRQDAWRTLGEESGPSPLLAIPVQGGEPMRLRVWSVDRRGGTADIGVAAASPEPIPESRLASGAEARPAAGFSPPIAVLRVALDRPGVFRLAGEETLWSPGRDRRAVAPEGLLEATGTTLWLARATGDRETSVRIGARRIHAAPGEDVSIEAGAPPAVVDLSRHAGPIVGVVTALSGRPALRIDGGSPAGFVPSAISSSGSAALAISLSGESRSASVWSAEEDGRPLELRLRTIAYSSTPADDSLAAGGTWSGSVSGSASTAFPLPPGRKTIRISLERDLAAALSRAGRVEATAWSRDEAVEEEFETEADRLTIFGLGGERKASISVLAAPAAGNGKAISFAAPLERNAIRREVLHRDVEGRAGEILRIRASGSDATYVSPDGRVREGADIRLDAGLGAVAIAHAPGPLICWIEDAAGHSGAWGALSANGSADVVSLPAAVDLSGNRRTLRVAPAAGGAPRLVHLRSTSPAVVGIGSARFEAFPEGIDLDIPTGSDPATIAVRGFAGAPLSGVLEIDSTPLSPAAEGLGEPILVPSGGTRAFSFRIAERGEIGLGVRASSEAIEAELLGPGGAHLGSGIVQMPTLEPGSYVLVVRVPRASAPVLVRPALAGLQKPGTGPPADVIRRYVHPEEATASRLETEPVASEATDRTSEETEEHGESATAAAESAESGDETAPAPETEPPDEAAAEAPPVVDEEPPPPEEETPPPSRRSEGRP